MYDGPQIPNNIWGNVADERNNKDESRNCFWCQRTDVRHLNNKGLIKCEKLHSCLCGFKIICKCNGGVKSIFIKKHQKTCVLYKNWKTEKYKINGAWIRRANERGLDLTNFKIKMGKSVSKSILNNPNERLRRSNLAKTTINIYAVSSKGRKKSSDVAKITSARKDIQLQRGERLRLWREKNPEKFKEIIKKFAANSNKGSNNTSKPEFQLFKELSMIGIELDYNKRLYHNLFNCFSKKHQIDMLKKENKIAILFDGPTHFKPIYGLEKLKKTFLYDKEVNDILSKDGWIVIRVCYDQYDYCKIGGNFNLSTFVKIIDILSSKIPGVYKIGGLFA